MPIEKIIKETKISHLDTAPALFVYPETSLSEAIKLMKLKQTGYVFICESDKLTGILTERDILLKVVGLGIGYDRPVKDFMTSNPITIKINDTLSTAMEILNKGSFRHLPIIDSSGKPISVVSARHIVNFIVEHFPQDVLNLPPHLNQISTSVEGG